MKNRYLFSKDETECTVFFNDGTFFIIDSNDFELVSKYTWFKSKRGYPVAHFSRKSPQGHKTFSLHRYLFNFPPSGTIDHIDRDKMNNRRNNLRLCTQQQNSFNQSLRVTNSSGYTGVSINKATGMFEAYIHYKGKKKYLGLYTTAEEAAVVRDKEALKIFGKYANLNFPDVA